MPRRVLVASLALVAGASALQTGVQSAFRASAKAAVSRAAESASAAALAAVFAAALVAPDAAQALSKETYNSLTYDQIKGTGLANKCPDVTPGAGNINLGGKLNKFDEFCMQPTEVSILETVTDKKGVTKTEIIPSKVRALAARWSGALRRNAPWHLARRRAWPPARAACRPPRRGSGAGLDADGLPFGVGGGRQEQTSSAGRGALWPRAPCSSPRAHPRFRAPLSADAAVCTRAPPPPLPRRLAWSMGAQMMTRQTGTLAMVEGDLVTDGGKVVLKEKDGARSRA